jgi:hypothetical protein
MRILAIDAGTTESGFCIMDFDTYKPLFFGKEDNEEILKYVLEGNYDALVYEEFQSYGMSVGKSTITSITWNGRFIQAAVSLLKPYYPIYRAEEKIAICGTMKAKDANIRQALIDRFAQFDLKQGKGTKNNPDFFYGFAKDCWSAFCVGTTWIDKIKQEYNNAKRIDKD